jgi:hypothetical protein
MFIRICCFLWMALILMRAVPAHAVGQYDGVWVGTEVINFAGERETQTTGSVFYQEDDTTLHFWDEFVGSVRLVKSGNKWVLPAPVDTTYAGVYVVFSAISFTFQNDSHFTGTIDFSAPDYGLDGDASLNHYKQTCQSLTNGSEISNLSGGPGDFDCYEIEVPPQATDLQVTTSGGTGDCDLGVIYHRPPI